MSNPKALKQAITDHIGQHGPMCFAKWMNTVLNHPRWGYYSNKEHIFGASGDFITASEHCPLYSYFIAQYAAKLDDPCKIDTILEVGPGSGAFAIGFLKAAHLYQLPLKKYYLYEPSLKLRQKLQVRFKHEVPEFLDQIQFLETLESIKISGMIILNEIFDVLPVHLFEYTKGQLLERKLALKQDKLILQTTDNTNQNLNHTFAALLEQHQDKWECGYQSEICLEAKNFIEKMAKILSQGYIFIHDYGHEAPQYYHPSRSNGTLRCFYQHQVSDQFFQHMGQQDISASVNFTQLADFGQEQGLELLTYANQLSFLGQLDIPDTQAIKSQAHQSLDMRNQLRCLLLPEMMGECFKMMVLKK